MDLPAETWWALVDQARAGRLPEDLVATVAVEAQRTLTVCSRDTTPPTTLAAQLCEHATPATQRVLPAAGRRLAEYAAALRRGDPRLPSGPPKLADTVTQVVLNPSLRMKAAWDLAAGADGTTTERWATAMLGSGLPAPIAWEAAAAERGQTLLEWALVYAARG